eukprot:33509-Amphidinium_carterae.1
MHPIHIKVLPASSGKKWDVLPLRVIFDGHELDPAIFHVTVCHGCLKKLQEAPGTTRPLDGQSGANTRIPSGAELLPTGKIFGELFSATVTVTVTRKYSELIIFRCRYR